MKKQASQGPGRLMAFFDNYKAAFLLVTAFLISFAAVAQVPQKINAYGYEYKRVYIDTVLRVPQSLQTLSLADSGAIAFHNGRFWQWTGFAWDTLRSTIGGGAGGATYDSVLMASTKRLKDTANAIRTDLNGKQPTLVSATNIKTVNGNSLLGSGDLTVSGGSGTPGGSNTQVQFNNSGAFGGDAALTWNTASKALGINGKILFSSRPPAGVGDSLGVYSKAQSDSLFNSIPNVPTYLRYDGTGPYTLNRIFNDSLMSRKIRPGTNISFSIDSDSTLAISSSGGISGSGASGIPAIWTSSSVLGSATQWPVETQQGILYKRNKWYSLNDFSINGNASLALNTTNIDLTGGSGLFTDYATFGQGTTSLGLWSAEYDYKITATGSGSAIGMHWANSSSTHDLCAFFTNNGGASNIYLTNSSRGVSTQFATSVSTVTFSAGDSIQLIITYNYYTQTVTGFAKNVSTGSNTSVSYTFPAPSSSELPNTGQWAIWSMGGTQTIYNIAITSNETRNALLECLVDSKGTYYATTAAGGWVNLLRGSYTTVIGHGGEGDNFDVNISSMWEILRQNPYQVIIGGDFRNSLARGVTVPNLVKQIDTVITILRNTGIKPLIFNIPEGSNSGQSTNLKILTDSIKAKWGAYYVPVFDSMVRADGINAISSYLNGDSIHPSPTGHTRIYNILVGSGMIQLAPYRTSQKYKSDGVVGVTGDSIFMATPIIKTFEVLTDSTLRAIYTDNSTKTVKIRGNSSGGTYTIGDGLTNASGTLKLGGSAAANITLAMGANIFQITSSQYVQMPTIAWTSDNTNDIGYVSNRGRRGYFVGLNANNGFFGDIGSWGSNNGTIPVHISPSTNLKANTVLGVATHNTSTWLGGLREDGTVFMPVDSLGGTAPGGMVVRDASTGNLRVMAIPGGGTSYTFTNGLTNVSGTVSLGGQLPASLTQITGSGTNSSLYFGGGSGVDAITFQPVKNVGIVSGLAISGWNAITSGTSSTIPLNGFVNTVINPASLIASYTLTMPATGYDGHVIYIFAGGTITSGNTVVTSFTLSPNSGQTLIQSSTPTTLKSGDYLAYIYYNAISSWFRMH